MAPMWKKKKSIFWELPYWEVLDVRHAIDVMHLTKNLCVNLIAFLGVYGKTKDTVEARQELQRMEERHIVLSGKRNIVGVEDKTDFSEEYNNFVAIPPFEVNADPCILLANDDAPYLRRDHKQGTLLLLILHVLESFYIIV